MTKVFYVLFILGSAHTGPSVDHFDTEAECKGALKTILSMSIDVPGNWNETDVSTYFGGKCERVEVTISQ